ncbi:hypothetical protein L1987_45798 [Smallanthus sonchifolius]|uniref:Uncharacterized protein n=1 Tax=Smallanthus sonchifolius TaxID=185202 RepID=A0ACB9FYL6_9ASTR|nr:hypothetical protein L1987_45798 [Smallanthus sonchifolius]
MLQLLSHTEEFIAEADDVLGVNTEVLEINYEQTPPSKGIVFTDPELQKKEKTKTRLDKGKGKAKEVPEKHKSKRSRGYELVDEEFLNYATRETADVVSQLKTQISNLQSREATNSREIRELKTESTKQKGVIAQQQQQIDQIQKMVQDLIALTGVQIGTNLAENVEEIHSPAATEPIPSTSEQVQTPVFEATMYEDNMLIDVDILLNDEGEGLEKIDENQEETEKEEEEEDVEEVVITGERKDDNNTSDDDNNSGGTGGVGGTGKKIEDVEQETPTNTEYKKYEYEQQQTYVEEDGSVIGKLDKLVDEREPFIVSEDIESPSKRPKTQKIDKSAWWTVTEKPSIVEKSTQTIKSPEQALTGEILAWMYDGEKKMYSTEDDQSIEQFICC